MHSQVFSYTEHWHVVVCLAVGNHSAANLQYYHTVTYVILILYNGSIKKFNVDKTNQNEPNVLFILAYQLAHELADVV